MPPARLPDPYAPSPLPSFAEVDDIRQLVIDMGGKAHTHFHQDRIVLMDEPTMFGRRQRRVELAACGHRAVLDVPDPDESDARTRICVICDCAQLMPRLA